MDLWKEDINIYPIAAHFIPQGGFSPCPLENTVKLGRFGYSPVNLGLGGAAVECFGIVKVSLFISEHFKPKFVAFTPKHPEKQAHLVKPPLQSAGLIPQPWLVSQIPTSTCKVLPPSPFNSAISALHTPCAMLVHCRK